MIFIFDCMVFSNFKEDVSSTFWVGFATDIVVLDDYMLSIYVERGFSQGGHFISPTAVDITSRNVFDLSVNYIRSELMLISLVFLC